MCIGDEIVHIAHDLPLFRVADPWKVFEHPRSFVYFSPGYHDFKNCLFFPKDTWSGMLREWPSWTLVFWQVSSLLSKTSRRYLPYALFLFYFYRCKYLFMHFIHCWICRRKECNADEYISRRDTGNLCGSFSIKKAVVMGWSWDVLIRKRTLQPRRLVASQSVRTNFARKFEPLRKSTRQHIPRVNSQLTRNCAFPFRAACRWRSSSVLRTDTS